MIALARKTVKPTHILLPQEKCDTPVWHIGDYWKFQDEDGRLWSHKVIKVENDLYLIENHEDRCTYIYDIKTLQPKLKTDDGSKKIISSSESDNFYNFPLFMGKKWTQKVSRNIWGMPPTYYLYEFEIILFEDVAVPAGTYKAFRIEFTRKSSSGTSSMVHSPKRILSHPNYIKYHIWYSPEAKNIIKYFHVGQKGDWKKIERNYELIAFESPSQTKE